MHDFPARVKRFLRDALLLLSLLGAGALLFVAAGLVPVAADKGHWPITRALLQFAMERSVATRSLPIDVPPLDDPALVRKGAGHYANGCMPCHGAPGSARPVIPRRMLPEPPPLVRTLAAGGWSPKELFWIVKHGIKYTAMPAWPAPDRDDEVWAMVAFLERLPGLSPAEFRRLAFGGGDLAPGTCDGCHGSGGAGADAFPRLAGLDAHYLRATLLAFATGRRQSGVMQPIAAALDSSRMDELVRRYASAVSGRVTPRKPADTAMVARGRQLATRGEARRRIPACSQCHGPGAGERNPLYPDLAGQHESYLALQLRLFARGGRGGTDAASLMERAAAALEPADIRDLAAYYASLPPSTGKMGADERRRR
jgi:cytochrome c553